VQLVLVITADLLAGGYLLLYGIRRERRDKPAVVIVGGVLTGLRVDTGADRHLRPKPAAPPAAAVPATYGRTGLSGSGNSGSRSRALGGAGLGLSIVAAVVAAHGGSVEVDSLPGHGSTFRVLLPLASTPVATHPEM
jgi:hypothetical protein